MVHRTHVIRNAVGAGGEECHTLLRNQDHHVQYTPFMAKIIRKSALKKTSPRKAPAKKVAPKWPSKAKPARVAKKLPAKAKSGASKPWTVAEVYEAFDRFRKANPEPKGELEHLNPYTLLVAVVLSAQATDAGVNKATRALFAVADTP